MMQLAELMRINAGNLAGSQFMLFKAHVLAVLRDAYTSVSDDNYEAVLRGTFSIPADGGSGTEHGCFDFGWGEAYIDIAEACKVLVRLREKMSATDKQDKEAV
jgi:hypothetical protein